MKSIERLLAEHELIERALNLLESAIAELEDGGDVPDGFVEWVPRFFSRFADQCHHAKEEEVLFPKLMSRGIPLEGGPIGVMLEEHALGRDCVQRMSRASLAEPVNVANFISAAREYIPLLRHHIQKENNVLFQFAERAMSVKDDEEVSKGFARIEKENGHAGCLESKGNEIARWEASFLRSSAC